MNRKWLLGVFGSGLLFASPALAQAPETPAEPEATSSQDDIVVTATRRQESAQDVAISVVAVSQDQLTEAQVTGAADLAKVAPGLMAVAGAGNPSTVDYSIRGRGLTFGSAAGSVETYFAEIPLSPPFTMPSLPPQFFDLASVQVLKGPQGTLFGRSTTGGAVLIQPQMPTGEFEGYGRVGAGNFHAVQIEGAINLPIIEDVLALRLSGFHNQRQGYLTQATTDAAGNPIIDGHTGQQVFAEDGNQKNVTELRGILRFTPTATFTNDILITYHEDQNYGVSGPGLTNTGGVITASPGEGTYTTYNSLNSDASWRDPNRAWAIINTTSLDLTDNLTLRNIAGYIRAEGNVLAGQDSDGATTRRIDNFAPHVPNLNEQYTEELQLQGNALNDRLEYTVGALADITRQPQDLLDLNASSLSVNTTLPADPNHPLAAGYRARYSSTNIDSYAVYIAGSYDLTEKLSLSAGFRHTWDEITSTVASSLHNSSYSAPGY